jgi:hypothetical protein
MDNVFTAGEFIPYSGVYRITHYPPHVSEETITLAKGSSFPHCVDCAQVSFMLLNEFLETNPLYDSMESSIAPDSPIRNFAMEGRQLN